MTFSEKLKNKKVILYYISHYDLVWFQHIFSLYDVICIKSFENINELTAAVLKNRKQDVYFVFWIELSLPEIIKMFRVINMEKIENYYYITNDDYKELVVAYLIEYLYKRNIDINEDIIQIGNFKMINFFKDKKYSIEMEDFILPCLFHDHTMLQDGPYEFGQVHLCKGDIVFDCGAHNGAFSMYSLIKGCEVHAFEPVPMTYNRLKNNMNLYKTKNVNMVNKGVWSHTGQQSFYLSDDSATDSAILYKDGHVETLEVISIDEYVLSNHLNRVNFVKADIEGAESRMLEGMRETIHKYHPKLSICSYHKSNDPEVLENLIYSIYNKYIILHKWNKIYAYVD